MCSDERSEWADFEADPDSCQDYEGTDEDGEEVTYTQCGEVTIEEADGGYQYVWEDIYSNEGERFGYVSGSAWWYEDFPNLDLSIMGEGGM